jgi:aryl-alcohol dehydrogenase-like predicted oxidoreductase
VLATKCGLLFPSARNSLPPRCLRRESILRECELSLRRLRVDVIDLYQCHWPDPETPIRESMDALMSLREQGKVRCIGLSNFGVDQITAAREYGPVHAVQSAYSLIQARAAQDLLPFCREHGLAFLAYSPLGRGLLTGKFKAESHFEDLRARDPEFAGRRFIRHLELVERLRAIARRYEKTVAQLALNWVLGTEGVTAALCGAKRPSQLAENLGAMGWRMSREDRNEIDELLKAAP